MCTHGGDYQRDPGCETAAVVQNACTDQSNYYNIAAGWKGGLEGEVGTVQQECWLFCFFNQDS